MRTDRLQERRPAHSKITYESVGTCDVSRDETANVLDVTADCWRPNRAQQLVDGQAKDALATFQRIPLNGLRDSGVAMTEHTLGDTKASQQALDKVIATAAGESAYQIAEADAWRREKDKAIEWLERAYRQQDGGLSETKVDRQLASLRSDPRYAALLRKMNFPP